MPDTASGFRRTFSHFSRARQRADPIDPLSRLTRRLLAGQLLLGLADGLVTTTWFVYLAQGRGFGAAFAGYSLAARALGMIAVVPVTGWLVDRYGPRRAVFLGTLGTLVGALTLGLSDWASITLAGSVLYGVGNAMAMPATRVVLVNSVTSEQRPRATSASFSVWSIGIGVGGLLGGVGGELGSSVAIPALFLAAAILALVVRLINLPAMPRRQAARSPGLGGVAVATIPPAARRAMLQYSAFSLTLTLAGWGQITATVPGFATLTLGVPTIAVGVGLASYTVAIIAATPVATRFALISRPSSVLLTTCAIWCVGWLVLMGTSSFTPSAPVAVTALLVFFVLFGSGGALYSSVAVPLVAALAPSGRLGSFVSFDTFVRQVGMAIAPVFAGYMIAGSHAVLYTGSCLIILAVGSILALIWLRRLQADVAPSQSPRT